MTKGVLFFITLVFCAKYVFIQSSIAQKPRILISSDIGGTDPDDNQSMAHFLMYNNLFDIEGLVSSPSFGDGNKSEILRMIDLYEKDLPKLKKHQSGFHSASFLRSITKQGRHGAAPMKGFDQPTEGSNWIISCAQKEAKTPLWVLAWGGLEDLAQALHDAPEIKNKIRVYWIGGPNKKWSVNSYNYIVSNFPDLWIIEANASYRGLFSNTDIPDSLKNDHYYNSYVRTGGYLGADFINYYDGKVKMGDTPSLLYMMNGNPTDPLGSSWGGRFVKINHSAKKIFTGPSSELDTVAVYGVMEFKLKGPLVKLKTGTPCIKLTAEKQVWEGYYLGDGNYMVRYAPKQAGKLSYKIESDIAGFKAFNGSVIVRNLWPGKRGADDFILGDNWYSEPSDANFFDKEWQGAKTVLKWRDAVLADWITRWRWLSGE